jgi:two-component system, response regulator
LTLRGLKRANLQRPIDVVRDGQEALDYLSGTNEQPPRRVPAVVLLDLKLPRIDGLDVLKRIRTEKRTQRVPVARCSSWRQRSEESCELASERGSSRCLI